MNQNKEAILQELANAVVDMNTEKVKLYAHKALANRINPNEAICNGLAKGMEKVSELFRNNIYYIPEIMICGDTMNAGLEILKPYIHKEACSLGKIVIGVVEGDCHDIGKNIVVMMLEGAGFEVYDLGIDVPLNKFIDKAREVDADIIAMSCLMSTTRKSMEKVIDALQDIDWSKKPYAIIGGAAISSSYAERIGADGYSADACDAVKLAKSLMSVRERGGAIKCG